MGENRTEDKTFETFEILQMNEQMSRSQGEEAMFFAFQVSVGEFWPHEHNPDKPLSLDDELHPFMKFLKDLSGNGASTLG